MEETMLFVCTFKGMALSMFVCRAGTQTDCVYICMFPCLWSGSVCIRDVVFIWEGKRESLLFV